MNFIDSHTHLYLKEFDHDRDQVVKDALSEGVKYMLLPNIDSSSIAGMQKMVKDYPGVCFPMMGLHPSSVKSGFEKELRIVEDYLLKDKFVAIGETGIDLYWDKKFREQQIESFEIQIKWAKEKNLPLVIHARESFKELFSVLDKYADKNLKGVFHSFTGNYDEAKHVMEYGFFFGINGIITFKNSGLDKIVQKIPPEMIILETDSPYLAPVPNRGKRNESRYLKYIAGRLAEIYGLPSRDLAGIASENTRSLFVLEHFITHET